MPDGPEEESAFSRIAARAHARISAAQRRLDDFRDRYGDRALVGLGLRIYERDRQAAGTVVGAAVAFRLFLFFIPMLLFLVGLTGFLGRWVDADEANEQIGVTGHLANQVATALSQPGVSRWSATIVGLTGVVLAGRSLSKVLLAASCLAWRMPVRTRASLRVVGGIVGIIVGTGLLAAIVNRIRNDLGIAVAGVSFLAVFVAYALAWIAVSMVLPRATTDPGALLPGGILVGATLTGMQAIGQLYLPNRFGRASELYGAIGAAIVTLGWFFIAGRAIVLATVLNAVVHERFGSISRVVFAVPVIRILPRRSAWIRRFFDLDGRPDAADHSGPPERRPPARPEAPDPPG